MISVIAIKYLFSLENKLFPIFNIIIFPFPGKFHPNSPKFYFASQKSFKKLIIKKRE